MVNISLNSYNVPGVYINEGTIGTVNQDLADHANVYMLGTSTGVADIPTLVSNYTDFVNTFPSSPSAKSVRLYFSQRPGSGLYFISVSKKTTRTVAIVGDVDAGNIYTLTINSFPYTVVAAADDEDILARFRTLFRSQPAYVGSLEGGVLRLPASATVTATPNITLGSAVVPAGVGIQDISDSLEKLDSQLNPGFLIAPEFYESFTLSSDRDLLFQACETFVSQGRFNWVHIADVGLNAGTEQEPSLFLQKNLAERVNKASPRGSSWLYTPYIKDSNNAFVPYSAFQVGIQIKAMMSASFFTPAAGQKYPLSGGVFAVDIKEEVNGALYEKQINCGRNFKDGTGYLTWGVKTLSTSTYYVDITTRIVLNVIARTARDAFREFMFNVVEGFFGVTLTSATATGVSILERIFRAGGLFGATSADAYLVVCDDRNNTPADLQNGRLHILLAVKPSPVAQYIVVDLVRASLDTVLINLFASKDGTNAETDVDTEGNADNTDN